ncbi:MAG: hypothetical protein N0E59_02225 [Candidatus Thiodiazotropha taylori]|nr:hypothetical protein [Candidatus Thiodiazotropha taylori]
MSIRRGWRMGAGAVWVNGLRAAAGVARVPFTVKAGMGGPGRWIPITGTGCPVAVGEVSGGMEGRAG